MTSALPSLGQPPAGVACNPHQLPICWPIGMNMYVVSQKSEAFFPAVLYGSVDVIQKGLGAPEHIQNLFHIETRIIIFS